MQTQSALSGRDAVSVHDRRRRVPSGHAQPAEVSRAEAEHVLHRWLNRGQERYDIYCSPCHDRTGGGNGMVIQRGFKRQPPSYHIERLRQADVGYFFDVITNGFGAMPDYRAQIAPRDRWAIVAYIRALQLSQHAAASDVPGGDPTKVPQPGGGERAPEKH